jgi:PAS domain S-box-containing protein
MKMNVSPHEIKGRTISKSSIRLLLSICLIIFIAGACSILVINWQMKIYAREEAREKALMMLDRNLAIHAYFSHQLKPDLFKKMKPIMADNYFDPVWMSSTYAVREMDRYYQSLAKKDYYYKECAINARNPENEADKFERAFIEKLNKTPGLTEEAKVRVINGKPYFVVLRRGETMEQSCLRCHSTPAAAPVNLVARYGSVRSFDRSVGEVVSAVSIRIPLGIAYAKVDTLVLHMSILLGATLLIVFVLAAFLSKRWVFDPLNTIRINATEISKDMKLLGKQIDLPPSYELSELTKAFNAMSFQLRKEQDRLESHVKERTMDLKQTRDMLQAVLDAAPAGIMVAEATGRVLLASAAAQRIFGNTVAGDAHGSEGGAPVPVPNGSPASLLDQLPLSLSLTGQTVTDKEILIQRADGSEAVLLASATPLRTDEGDIWGAVSVFKDMTRMKKSEDELRRLSHFPDENPNPIMRCTLDGVTLYANVPARHWLTTLGWQDGGPLPATVRAAVVGAREQENAIENEITDPEGRTMKIFAVQPPGADYINLYGMDFTERKQAEQALLASEQRLRWALQGSGGGAWDWDLTSGEAWWSQEMYDLWGVAPGTKMELDNSLALIHEQDRECLRRAVEESVTRHTDFRCEFRIRHGMRGERWMASYGRPVYEESGRSDRLLGITLDITGRKLAEEALRQSEERLKKAQEIAHLGSWELDLEKNELTWSDEVYRIFGLPRHQSFATYEAFLSAVHPDDRSKVDEAYSASLSDNNDTYEIEHRIVKPDGEIGYVHEKCEHHKDSSGRIIRSVGTVHDITEQKLVQAALQRSNKELEQFAYVASHDLQEPLRAVVGFLQLIQSRYGYQIDEKGRHFIERSVKAGNRMQRLIRELLTLSRVNTQGAAFAPTDLNHIVKDALENLHTIIREKNTDITCAALPVLTVDAGQIQRLFQNLIMNAVKYNENPKPVIDIGCRKQKNVYLFFVKDNGIGISPEFHQRIFMLFQRLHTESEYPGTGLGLALCKKIVERHGGKIWVESQGKEGSTFNFTLPKKL